MYGANDADDALRASGHRRAAGPALVLAAALAGCVPPPHSYPPGPAQDGAEYREAVRVHVEPRALELSVWETKTFAVAVTGTADTRVRFRSPGSVIAAVDSTGVVRGYRPGTTFVEVVPLADTTAAVRVHVRVAHDRWTVLGTVIDHVGRAVPGVPVELRSGTASRPAVTGEDGRFELVLPLDAPRPWLLHVSPPVGYAVPATDENPRALHPMRNPMHVTVMLMASGVAAAEPPVPPRDGSPVQTDSLEYTLEHRPSIFDAQAVAHYVNRTGRPVHFARCRSDDPLPIYEIRREGPGERTSIIGYARGCVGAIPTGVVAPGDSLVAPVWLGSAESPYANPPITMAHRTGCFRILLALVEAPATDSDYARPLPDEMRRSNVFCIRPPHWTRGER
jgi:hypothetical protein